MTATMTTMTHADPSEQRTALAGEIATLDDRRTELNAEAARVSGELKAERDRLGQLVADGHTDVAAKRSRVRDLAGELESIESGRAIIRDQLVALRREQAALDLAITVREAATGDAEAAIVAFLHETARRLSELHRAWLERRGEAAAAWGRKLTLDRQAGRIVDLPMASPGSSGLVAPGVGMLVDQLLRFAAGQTSAQVGAQMGAALRESVRSAVDPVRRAIAAEEGDAIENRGSRGAPV
jgi:hypothetical protein